MVKIKVWGSLQTATNNEEYVEVDASNFKEVLDALVSKYPKLKPQIKRGVSVAIDGVIYKDSWFTPINDSNEVVLMPYMEGG
tara:strand:+ start:78 stop:323 length:246 start_codon:yes stop_codon:yes gene_type:complete